jgi:uncharacterized protein YqjF (DUF2071 family)
MKNTSTKTQSSFLKAEWRKLIMANYVVDPKVLAAYIPAGTELDFWEGKCYISLVGFLFTETKLLGVRIPFHSTFEEVNLRFYVRCKVGDTWKRGVVFIKEIVPKLALSLVANLVYKENYVTMPMYHKWEEVNQHLKVEYGWWNKNKLQQFSALAHRLPSDIAVGSENEFITEHYWGYSRAGLKTYEYEVKHPKWQVYHVQSFESSVDFGFSYGSEFEFLNSLKPASVMLAEGSEISVEKRRLL